MPIWHKMVKIKKGYYSNMEERLLKQKLIDFNLQLREVRQAKGIKQIQIARESDLSKQMVSKMESENGNPSLMSLLAYCHVIGVDLMDALKADGYRECELFPEGEWITVDGFVHCSNCNHQAYWDTDYGQQKFNYCPYCGAKMEKNNEIN